MTGFVIIGFLPQGVTVSAVCGSARVERERTIAALLDQAAKLEEV